MKIGQASVLKFTKTGIYIIHCVSKTKMGIGIISEPVVKCDTTISIDEIVRQILYVTSCSKSDLPNPQSWSSVNKEYLNLLGLKRNNEIYRNVLNVGISYIDDTITFTPMVNNGPKGFVNVVNGQISLPIDTPIEKLSQALIDAFNKCE